MKLDQLEQFVLDHRDEFDDLVPREEPFKEFDAPKAKIIRLKSWKTLLRVAAAMLIFALGFALNDLLSPNYIEGDKIFAKRHKEVSGSDSLRNAFEEMQVYYSSQINTVKNEIILLSKSDEVISDELDYQMQEFNSIFEELKNDLNDQANEEDVIEAMIQNYRVKLRLLEDMKAQLNSTNQEEEEDQYEIIDI